MRAEFYVNEEKTVLTDEKIVFLNRMKEVDWVLIGEDEYFPSEVTENMIGDKALAYSSGTKIYYSVNGFSGSEMIYASRNTAI